MPAFTCPATFLRDAPGRRAVSLWAAVTTVVARQDATKDHAKADQQAVHHKRWY